MRALHLAGVAACGRGLSDQSCVSAEIRGKLCLRLSLYMLVGSLDLGRVLLYPFGTDVCEVTSSNASKYYWHEVRWDPSLHRLSQHRLFNLALLEPQRFLPRLLLLLLSSFFLGLCG